MSRIGDLLANYSGSIHEHAPFLTNDEAAELHEHVQRIYGEFITSAQSESDQEPPPSEADLSGEAMAVAFDIVFNVAYELGQTDRGLTDPHPGVSVTLDEPTTQLLVQHALGEVLRAALQPREE